MRESRQVVARAKTALYHVYDVNVLSGWLFCALPPALSLLPISFVVCCARDAHWLAPLPSVFPAPLMLPILLLETNTGDLAVCCICGFIYGLRARWQRCTDIVSRALARRLRLFARKIYDTARQVPRLLETARWLRGRPAHFAWPCTLPLGTRARLCSSVLAVVLQCVRRYCSKMILPTDGSARGGE